MGVTHANWDIIERYRLFQMRLTRYFFHWFTHFLQQTIANHGDKIETYASVKEL